MSLVLGVLAISFLVLWLVERSKVKAVDNIKAARAEADQYVTDKHNEADQYATNKQAEADTAYEEKHREALDYYWKKTKSADERVAKAEDEIEKLKVQKADLESEIDLAEQDALCAMTSLDTYDGLRSDEIKNQLALLKTKQDAMVRDGSAVLVVNQGMTKREANSQIKQLLRCFNSESAAIIGNMTVKNVDSTRQKIQRSFDALNKVFSIDGVQISDDFYATKLEELSLVFAYITKLEDEKEQKKAIREQMVEEEKVRREIEREKQKIEKEESQFSREVQKLMGYMQKAKDDVEKNLYIEKIKELEDKLSALAADKENVLQREQNTRAGFVYIISNIGSFGENVYKIGMTRRLDPMDRIAELSSASVPFPFDVHAMIFSEDAPALETLLHHHFDAFKVNKVNARKEFYRIDLDEIKKLVLAEHNATVHFVDIPEAEEYRETQRIESAS